MKGHFGQNRWPLIVGGEPFRRPPIRVEFDFAFACRFGRNLANRFQAGVGGPRESTSTGFLVTAKSQSSRQLAECKQGPAAPTGLGFFCGIPFRQPG